MGSGDGDHAVVIHVEEDVRLEMSAEDALHFCRSDFHDFMILVRQLHDLVDVSKEHTGLMQQSTELRTSIHTLKELTDTYESKLRVLKDIREKHKHSSNAIKGKYRAMSIKNIAFLSEAKKQFLLIKNNTCSDKKKKEIIKKYIKK